MKWGALTAGAVCKVVEVGGAGLQATGARALQRFVHALGPRAERFRSGARRPPPLAAALSAATHLRPK